MTLRATLVTQSTLSFACSSFSSTTVSGFGWTDATRSFSRPVALRFVLPSSLTRPWAARRWRRLTLSLADVVFVRSVNADRSDTVTRLRGGGRRIRFRLADEKPRPADWA